jgi:hypothetical protein
VRGRDRRRARRPGVGAPLLDACTGGRRGGADRGSSRPLVPAPPAAQGQGHDLPCGLAQGRDGGSRGISETRGG